MDCRKSEIDSQVMGQGWGDGGLVMGGRKRRMGSIKIRKRKGRRMKGKRKSGTRMGK